MTARRKFAQVLAAGVHTATAHTEDNADGQAYWMTCSCGHKSDSIVVHEDWAATDAGTTITDLFFRYMRTQHMLDVALDLEV